MTETRLQKYIEKEVESTRRNINQQYDRMAKLFEEFKVVEETHYPSFKELVFEAPLGWYACRDYPQGDLFDLALKDMEDKFRKDYDIIKITIGKSAKDNGFELLICKCTVKVQGP